MPDVFSGKNRDRNRVVAGNYHLAYTLIRTSMARDPHPKGKFRLGPGTLADASARRARLRRSHRLSDSLRIPPEDPCATLKLWRVFLFVEKALRPRAATDAVPGFRDIAILNTDAAPKISPGNGTCLPPPFGVI